MSDLGRKKRENWINSSSSLQNISLNSPFIPEFCASQNVHVYLHSTASSTVACGCIRMGNRHGLYKFITIPIR